MTTITTTTSYDAICEQLDTLALQYLTKLNEYTQQWQDTSNEFQQGYLDLAHAKYSMGARTISHFSYDERMKAILQVDMDDSNKLFSKQVTQPPPTTTKEEENVKKDGLRKRHEPIKKKNTDWVQTDNNSSSENDEIELDEKKNKKIKKSGDPLHWFGLFGSSSLRKSQVHFKTATEQLIYQVNRINELKSIEKKYHELQEEKLVLQLQRTKLQEDVKAA